MGASMAELSRRRSVLLAAIGYLAKKESQRDDLSTGSTRVQGVVAATIGRGRLEYPFCGQLIVGADQSAASSSAPDAAHVCAVLLDRLPAGDRVRLLEQLPRDFAKAGQLPAVAEDTLAAVKGMLARLRSKKTTTKRGSVVFQTESPTAPAEAEAA